MELTMDHPALASVPVAGREHALTEMKAAVAANDAYYDHRTDGFEKLRHLAAQHDGTQVAPPPDTPAGAQVAPAGGTAGELSVVDGTAETDTTDTTDTALSLDERVKVARIKELHAQIAALEGGV